MISHTTKKRIYTSLFLFALIYLIINYKFILGYTLIVLGVISLLEFYNLIVRILKKKIYLLIINLTFLLYLSIFSFAFFILDSYLEFKLMIFILLFGCIASDIGGYIFGNLFKGVKLTKISPNKTISGSAGSLFLTIVTMTSLIFLITKSVSLNLIVLSILTSIYCQLGDLFFSYLKRKAKIKDTGNFFPGHGGVLDRIDGILLAIPLGLITTLLIF
tara:strand:+ start:2766 stop:3416 length:651 start_codon:yes stop_codon:yes gene_type:complete